MRFMYNGIKDDSTGKLYKGYYSIGPWNTLPEGTITFYAKGYDNLSKLLHPLFSVENETDIQTDYFEKDKIRVQPDNPMYNMVLQAYIAQQDHRKKIEKRKCRA